MTQKEVLSAWQDFHGRISAGYLMRNYCYHFKKTWLAHTITNDETYDSVSRVRIQTIELKTSYF